MEGIVEIGGGSGEEMTVPNGAKDWAVRGTAGMVIFEEGVEGDMVEFEYENGKNGLM